MRDEEEVREFLQKLEIEYQFSCYKENNGEGCCLLGEFMQAVRSDFRRATLAFKKGCDKHDHPKACFKYGGDLFRGRGGLKRDFGKALEYQKKACELGWKEGCAIAGQQLDEDGPHKDPVAAMEYFKKSCDMNLDQGCVSASSMYHQGREGLPKDLEKSLHYAVRACDMGHMQSCANAAFLYKTGQGAEKSEIMATKYRNKALELRQQYTRNRGFEMEQGIKD